MGMFDYLHCEMPLPDTGVAPPEGTLFQTKDTPDQYMTVYTITADRKLSWRPYEMQEVPLAERPYPNAPEGDFRRWAGSMRRVEGGIEYIPYHGDIEFYPDADGVWVEYRARFTEGVCTSITLISQPQEPA